jgi:two-component system, NarL family, invasion response regulator UvrY
MKEKRINLAIADDHPLIREGLKNIICSFDGFEVTIEASDGQELIENLQNAEEVSDICILDIRMPRMDGYETLKELKRKWPSIKVLIFSAFYEEYSMIEMLRNGANGYLEKNCTPGKLQQALAYIYSNEYYYSEVVAKKIFDLHQHKSRLIPKITDREMEFLCYCCTELSYKEIGELMGVSVRTIEAFRDALFDKFSLKTRTGLAIFALQNGIVPLKNQGFQS